MHLSDDLTKRRVHVLKSKQKSKAQLAPA